MAWPLQSGVVSPPEADLPHPAAIAALLVLVASPVDAREPGPGPTPAPRAADLARLDEGVGAYVAVALRQSPDAREAFERWEAAMHRIARARTLPEPTIGFGLFVQSVETRVGPQQARLGLQQGLPWPTSLTAGGDAASAEARAAQERFEARALAVARRVEEAYWPLWEIRATRRTHQEHLDVLAGLSETLRARLEVGRATLADLQQVDLARARLADAIESMDEREVGATARLWAAAGVRSTEPAPTVVPPGPPELPADEPGAIIAAAIAHPIVSSLGHQVDAADATVRAAAARRWPSFTVGLDWIVTDASPMPEVEDSGRDAVIVGLGLRLPLWQGTYAQDIAAARATADALRAGQRALADDAAAASERWLAEVRDSARRVRVTEGTLVPLAETTYTSLLGSYAAGASTVAQVLLAQRDLLELRAELEQARADHAEAWAAFDEVTGGGIARRPAAEETP